MAMALRIPENSKNVPHVLELRCQSLSEESPFRLFYHSNKVIHIIQRPQMQPIPDFNVQASNFLFEGSWRQADTKFNRRCL